MEKEFYHRNLPHIQPKEGVFFVTFRLTGSLPIEVIEQLRLERDIKRNLIDDEIIQPGINFRSDSFFHKFDSLLDNPLSGPLWLKDEMIAKMVCESLHYLDTKDYKLICYSIMPNHVHLILYQIETPLYRILQSLKRFTGKEANKSIGRTGAFWQKESYDNLVRDREDLYNKINYVLNNPVRAKLATSRREHHYTFCNEKFLHYVD